MPALLEPIPQPGHYCHVGWTLPCGVRLVDPAGTQVQPTQAAPSGLWVCLWSPRPSLGLMAPPAEGPAPDPRHPCRWAASLPLPLLRLCLPRGLDPDGGPRPGGAAGRPTRSRWPDLAGRGRRAGGLQGVQGSTRSGGLRCWLWGPRRPRWQLLTRGWGTPPTPGLSSSSRLPGRGSP